MLDSGMINKMQKARTYADQPERIHFKDLKVEFDGNHSQTYRRVSRRRLEVRLRLLPGTSDVQPCDGARPGAGRDGAASAGLTRHL
jgi:hypothetical protein